MKNPRILLYSHNGFGVGHFAINAAIAKSLRASFPQADIILVTGGTLHQWITSMVPEGVEFIKIPSMRMKTATSILKPNKLHMGIQEVVDMRSAMILSLVKTFKPHFFIVDHVPFGVWDELKKTFNFLKKSKKKSLFFNRTILGFRGFDDFYHSIRGFTTEHRKKVKKLFSLIDNYYDTIFAYSTEKMINNKYAIPRSWIPVSIQNKMVYTGYLLSYCKRELPTRSHLRALLKIGKKKLIVVASGGSPDGIKLLKTYISIHKTLPENCLTVLFPGVFISKIQLKNLNQSVKNIKNIYIGQLHNNIPFKFVEFLKASDVFVGMAGYNTITEVLELCRSAVLMPQSTGKEIEQYVHAQMLEKRKLIQMVEPGPLEKEELVKKIKLALSKKFIPESKQFHKYLNGNKYIVSFIRKELNSISK